MIWIFVFRIRNRSHDEGSLYLYGIVASHPGHGEVIRVSPGQSLDEVILVLAVDRREVSLFKLTVKLAAARQQRGTVIGSLLRSSSWTLFPPETSIAPHLGFGPRLLVVYEDEAAHPPAGPSGRTEGFSVYVRIPAGGVGV